MKKKENKNVKEPETVWSALGVNDKKVDELMKRVRVAMAAGDSHTDEMDMLFPDMDNEQKALIYAYAVKIGEAQTANALMSVISAKMGLEKGDDE